MNIEKVKKEQEAILHHIMQFYIYEFSKFIPAIKLEENGAYSPFDLNKYWEDEQFHAYFIKLENELIGFALVETGVDHEPHSINEFFVVKKYNGRGYGADAAKQIFDLFQGKWQITQIHNNYPAQAFWRKVINEYTNGQYTEFYDDKRRSIQEFDTSGLTSTVMK
ncbi:GNAT family N-acetyltransferase [Bacillus sp. CGMCC 1.16607]|uniref:GNAT family N-acetyltransferase n=1 Tax=Bacillus sp. CGMCC 1.16607 TaxID=3351842 RepID=UPI00362DEEE6